MMSKNLSVYFVIENIVSVNARNVFLLSQLNIPAYDSTSAADEDIEKNTTPFPFLRLPLELREMILEYLFCSQNTSRILDTVDIWGRPFHNPSGWGEEARPTHPRVEIEVPRYFLQLFVARGFLREALPIISRQVQIMVRDFHLSDMIDTFSHVPFSQTIVEGVMAVAPCAYVQMEDHWRTLPNVSCPAEQHISKFSSLFQKLENIELYSMLEAAWLKAAKGRPRQVIDDNDNIQQRRLVAIDEKATDFFQSLCDFPRGLIKPFRNWLNNKAEFENAQKLLAAFKGAGRQCKCLY